MTKRGTSIIEMLLVVSLTGLVIGTMALLYGFTFGRVAYTSAEFSATDQARKVLNTISDTANQAITCQLVGLNGVTALKCTMPANGADTNQDGYNETYLPSWTSPRGVERYATGKRIWFYMSDSTGQFGSPGTVLWRAQRSDDQNPTESDADGSWTFYFDTGSQRHPLISALAFSLDSANHTTAVTVTATSLTRAERQAGAEVGSVGTYAVAYTRTVLWRNWQP